ncbi:MAG: hypothetical protein ACRCV6_05945 [Formosimonas sp.]
MQHKTPEQLLEETSMMIVHLNQAVQQINANQSQLAQVLAQTAQAVPVEVSHSAKAAQNDITNTLVRQFEQALQERLAPVDQRLEKITQSQQNALTQISNIITDNARTARFLNFKNAAILAAAMGVVSLGGIFMIWQGGVKIMEQRQKLVNVEMLNKLKINNCDGVPCKILERTYKKGEMIDLSQ